MEKIQKAIAKARASRDASQEDPFETGPGVDHPSQTPADVAAPQERSPNENAAQQVNDAWAALRPFEVSNRHLKKARITTLKGSRDAVTFDTLRTKTLQTMRANNWRRLAITSPSPACGKSTISLSMAFGLSRQTDIRTIVGELDMRRPSLAHTLGVELHHGIADVLRGEVDFADQAICYNRNLAFSLCSRREPQAAELLHATDISDRLADIEARFAPDLMIFDMPPMLVNDDMMAFAGQVDCVLLIAAAETTTIKEIDACERELASQTNVMGVALNKCRYMGSEYGYSYYN